MIGLSPKNYWIIFLSGAVWVTLNCSSWRSKLITWELVTASVHSHRALTWLSWTCGKPEKGAQVGLQAHDFCLFNIHIIRKDLPRVICSAKVKEAPASASQLKYVPG